MSWSISHKVEDFSIFCQDKNICPIIRNKFDLQKCKTYNPPSFLRARPTDKIINVEIHQNLATQGTDYTPLPARYTLILSLEQLDEDS